MSWDATPLAAGTLAVLVLATGCVGDLPIPPSDAPGSGTGLDASEPTQPARSPVASDASDDAVKLNVVLALHEDSITALSALEVDAEPLPEERLEFLANPGSISPGGLRYVAVLTVPPNTTVDAFTLDVELEDGRGRTQLSLQLGPWDADEEAKQVVHIRYPARGKVLFESMEGPLPGRSLADEAIPTYGRLVWPDGSERVLETFPHTVHVPEGYPDGMAKGTEVTFSLPDVQAPVTWRVEEDRVEDGPAYTVSLTPGVHRLSVHVGEDADLALPYRVADRLHFNGTALLGAQDPDVHVNGVNGDEHEIRVREHAAEAWIGLGVTEQAAASDLDLFVLDEEGEVVASAERQAHSHEVVRLLEPLEPGTYTLRVHAEQGVLVDYHLAVRVFY